MARKKRKNRSKPAPLLLLIGGGITLILVALLLFNQNNDTPSSSTITEEIPHPEIARVSLDEARSALDSGTAILLDVRSAEAYAAQHIEGAISIPSTEIESRLSELDSRAWIIPYCT
jgi:Rhodanese-like domain